MKNKKINKQISGKINYEDYENAFWDEFYLKDQKDIQTLTVEELEDETTLKIESKIPCLKTN